MKIVKKPFFCWSHFFKHGRILQTWKRRMKAFISSLRIFQMLWSVPASIKRPNWTKVRGVPHRVLCVQYSLKYRSKLMKALVRLFPRLAKFCHVWKMRSTKESFFDDLHRLFNDGSSQLLELIQNPSVREHTIPTRCWHQGRDVRKWWITWPSKMSPIYSCEIFTKYNWSKLEQGGENRGRNSLDSRCFSCFFFATTRPEFFLFLIRGDKLVWLGVCYRVNGVLQVLWNLWAEWKLPLLKLPSDFRGSPPRVLIFSPIRCHLLGCATFGWRAGKTPNATAWGPMTSKLQKETLIWSSRLKCFLKMSLCLT